MRRWGWRRVRRMPGVCVEPRLDSAGAAGGSKGGVQTADFYGFDEGGKGEAYGMRTASVSRADAANRIGMFTQRVPSGRRVGFLFAEVRRGVAF